MTNLGFLNFYDGLLKGEFDLSSDDVRALIVMSNTTYLSQIATAKFVGDITVLDEFNGANYVRKALANAAVAIDAPNNRVEFTADPSIWTALGAGTRQGVAAIIYKHVTNDADSPIISAFTDGGFPFTASGADFPINWNAEGLLQVATVTP